MPDEERVFDFFGLPRELRDEIYSILVHDITIVCGWDRESSKPQQIQVVWKDGPRTELFLLNHQFKTEYEQNSRSTRTLVFTDSGSSLDPPDMPDHPDMTTYAEIHILGSYAAVGADEGRWRDAIQDVPEHYNWIDNIRTGNQHIGINLYVECQCKTDLEWNRLSSAGDIAEELELLTKIPALESLEVYTFSLPTYYKEGDTIREDIPMSKQSPVAKWIPDEGWKKPRQDAGQAGR